MKTSPPNGFTLIEISIALLVLTVGILAIVGVSTSSLDAGRNTQDEQLAVAFADMVFGYYQSETNWSNIPPDGNYTIDDYANTQLTLLPDTQTLYENLVIDPTTGNTLTNGILHYTFAAAQNSTSTKELTLHIWPGYQKTKRPLIFHTKIYNWQQP